MSLGQKPTCTHLRKLFRFPARNRALAPRCARAGVRRAGPTPPVVAQARRRGVPGGAGMQASTGPLCSRCGLSSPCFTRVRTSLTYGVGLGRGQSDRPIHMCSCRCGPGLESHVSKQVCRNPAPERAAADGRARDGRRMRRGSRQASCCRPPSIVRRLELAPALSRVPGDAPRHTVTPAAPTEQVNSRCAEAAAAATTTTTKTTRETARAAGCRKW